MRTRLHFIKSFDCLSQDICLFFDNRRKHSCVFSGVLSVSYYAIIILLVLYYLYQVIFHKSFSLTYIKRHALTTEPYTLDEENFNHSLAFQGKMSFDPKAINVIGLMLEENLMVSNFDETLYDHWNYGPCLDGNSLCITSFYNHTEKKVYSLSFPSFPYPSIAKNKADYTSIPYSIIIYPCKNNSVSGSCYDENIIEEVLVNLISVKVLFTDKYIDIDKYKEPFVKHEKNLDINIMKNATIRSNVYFNPVVMRNHEKFVFDYTTEKKSHMFDQMIYGDFQGYNKEMKAMINFYMKGEVNVYERTYLGVCDIAIHVVCLSKIIWCLLFVINYLFAKYVIYNDFGEFYQNNFFKVIRLNSMNQGINPSDTLKSQKSSFIPIRTGKSKSSIEFYSFYKQSHYTLKKLVLHYFKCKINPFIDSLMKIRQAALSEEKLIKYHLMFSSLDNNRKNFLEKSTRGGTKSFMQSFIENDMKKKQNNDLNNSNTDLVKKQNFMKNE